MNFRASWSVSMNKMPHFGRYFWFPLKFFPFPHILEHSLEATKFHFAPWQPAALKGSTRGHSVDRRVVEPSAQEPGDSSRVDGQKVILKVRFVVA